MSGNDLNRRSFLNKSTFSLFWPVILAYPVFLFHFEGLFRRKIFMAKKSTFRLNISFMSLLGVQTFVQGV